jgi:hypothetical protein
MDAYFPKIWYFLGFDPSRYWLFSFIHMKTTWKKVASSALAGHAIPTTSFELIRLTYPHFWQKGLSKLALVPSGNLT